MESVTVAEIAARVGGVVEGDGTVVITGLAGLREAQPGDLSFLASTKYAIHAATTRASAILVAPDWSGACSCDKIRVAGPDRAFAAVVKMVTPPPVRMQPGVHASVVVAPDVRLGRDVCVGPHAVLEPGVCIGDRVQIGAGCYVGHETDIGDDSRLYPHVTIRERAKIGKRVIIHNGAVIGSDGFGYSRVGEHWEKIPQVGTVELGDDVEIGANVTIDRARFGKTFLANGVKVDNLVQIAHNVRVGEHTAIAAQVGIAGSAIIGRGVQLAGQSGVNGHLVVGDGVVVLGQSGVTKDAAPGQILFGMPAVPHRKASETHANVMRIGHLKERVAQLEQRIADLEKRASSAG